MTAPRIIGIIGGMGPEATILLQQKLVAAVPAEDDADHIPLIVDMNPQVPSRIARLVEGRGEDPGPVLVAMAARLEAAGAEALAMPCNTAHHYADAIRSAVAVPFLDMVAGAAEIAGRLVAQGGRVGLLASPAVHKVGLYDAALSTRGLTAIWPDDDAAILRAIRAIKAQGPCAEARAALAAASAQLVARGATLQLIACTEFSLIADSVAPDARAIDTLDALVDAIRSFAFGGASMEQAT